MSVGMAGWMSVHLVHLLIGELVGCRTAVIVMMRVNLHFGDMTMASVYAVVSLLAVDWIHCMVG